MGHVTDHQQWGSFRTHVVEGVYTYVIDEAMNIHTKRDDDWLSTVGLYQMFQWWVSYPLMITMVITLCPFIYRYHEHRTVNHYGVFWTPRYHFPSFTGDGVYQMEVSNTTLHEGRCPMVAPDSGISLMKFDSGIWPMQNHYQWCSILLNQVVFPHSHRIRHLWLTMVSTC